LLSAGADGTVLLWPANGGAPRTIGAGHQGFAWSVAPSPDATLVASSGADGVIEVWSLAEDRLVFDLRGHSGDVYAVDHHPSEPWLASAGRDGTVRIWNLDDGTGRTIDDVPGVEQRTVAWSPDGALLVVGGADGVVRRYRTEDFAPLPPLVGHTGEIRETTWSTGHVLLTAGRDRTVRAWDIDESRLTAVVTPHAADTRAVAVTHKGDLLVSTANDGDVRIWPGPTAWITAGCEVAERDLTEAEWAQYAGDTKLRVDACS
jgi:WD40 repeat protein